MGRASQGLIVAVALFASVPAAAAAEGYGRLDWGASPDTVRATYANTKVVSKTQIIQDVRILEMDARRVFQFDDGELEAVWIYFSNEVDPKGFKKLVELLGKKYGKPMRTDEDRVTVVWQDGQTLIELNGGGRPIQIAYTSDAYRARLEAERAAKKSEERMEKEALDEL